MCVDNWKLIWELDGELREKTNGVDVEKWYGVFVADAGDNREIEARLKRRNK